MGPTSRLHNVGKMGIPNSILQKPVKLVEDEFQIMCMHRIICSSILSPMSRIGLAKDMALGHHEHRNGNRLKGERTPLAARVAALVDVLLNPLTIKKSKAFSLG